MRTALALLALAVTGGAEPVDTDVAHDVSTRTERIETRVGVFEVRAETGVSPADALRRLLAGGPPERVFLADAP